MLDFNRAMAALVEDIVHRVAELRFIQPERVLISATFNRSNRRAGLLAYVLPLKFREGCPIERRVRGAKIYHWGMFPTVRGDKEVLYIIYFMLPRFYNLPLREKIETVIHELYHISPRFNGDLRWFKGRSRLHGSMEEYEANVRRLTDDYLSGVPSAAAYAFLQADFETTERTYGRVTAVHVPEPRPKLLKVAPYPETGSESFVDD